MTGTRHTCAVWHYAYRGVAKQGAYKVRRIRYIAYTRGNRRSDRSRRRSGKL